jgi:hypothetical protein
MGKVRRHPSKDTRKLETHINSNEVGTKVIIIPDGIGRHIIGRNVENNTTLTMHGKNNSVDQ